jgi:hypothetical protein
MNTFFYDISKRLSKRNPNPIDTNQLHLKILLQD